MSAKRNVIVQVGIVVEGTLVLIFLLWAYLRGFQDKLYPSLSDFVVGVSAAVLLCAANYLLFAAFPNRSALLRSGREFIDHVVVPLAKELGPCSALLVSVLAGVGEELFFRGVLQNEFGILLSSALFSLLHFGTNVRQYRFVAFLYFVIGLYFALLYAYFETLWVGIILHIFYDYFALLYLRYWHRGDTY